MLYAHDLLRALQAAKVQVHLVVTAGAKLVLQSEGQGQFSLQTLYDLADTVHKDNDLAACIASGSFRTSGMVVVPCSAGTLAKVAHGHADNLLTRAAHVTLKEQRRLILTVREAPYSRPMLVNMLAAHDAGAVLLSASPGFYHQPQTIAELIAGVSARTLDLLGIEHSWAKRWKEEA